MNDNAADTMNQSFQDIAQRAITESATHGPLEPKPVAVVSPAVGQKMSERERQVLLLTAEGFTNQMMADALGISIKTVESFRSRVFDKLGAKNGPHAITLAFRAGLLK